MYMEDRFDNAHLEKRNLKKGLQNNLGMKVITLQSKHLFSQPAFTFWFRQMVTLSIL